MSNNFGSIQSSDENYIESKSYELEYGYLSDEAMADYDWDTPESISRSFEDGNIDKELYEGRYTGINWDLGIKINSLKHLIMIKYRRYYNATPICWVHAYINRA